VTTRAWIDESGETRLRGTLDPDPLLEKTTNLTTAQLLAFPIAVELLPAPGGRFYYDVQHIVWHYRYGTTPYSGTFSDLVLGFYPAGVPFPSYNASAPTVTTFQPWSANNLGFEVFAQTQDVYEMAAVSRVGEAIGWLASNIEDKPLVAGLQNLSTYPDPLVPWTDGNGSLTIRIFYSLINGAA
jgi:hypothetical protein